MSYFDDVVEPSLYRNSVSDRWLNRIIKEQHKAHTDTVVKEITQQWQTSGTMDLTKL